MILDIKNIYKSFGSIEVLNDVNISIAKNECIGIIGPNGAGKSTLFKIISGGLRHDSGSIIYNNNNLNNFSNEKRARLGIAQSFQKNSLFPEMTIIESIMIAITHTSNLSFNFYSLMFNNKEIYNKAIEIVNQIGLKNYAEQKSETLSYGLQRQLELGIAIACNPKVLLLDEPTAGMSPLETQSIINLIKKLSLNYSIVIVEHDMEVIYNLANRIYVLDRGKIIFNGNVKDIKSSKLVQDRYLGQNNE